MTNPKTAVDAVLRYERIKPANQLCNMGSSYIIAYAYVKTAHLR